MERRKKVLFVVYRTEWWGCLDNYCRKECLAADTECYVMLVPRYERDEATFEVNFEKKHYEQKKLAAVLPKGAYMVDCERFSLEQGFEKIYIHNPYDNGSPIDTVDVKYYSLNLKQYTKELIYVSHFPNVLPDGYVNCKVYDYVDTIYIPNERARFSLDVKYDKKAKVMPSGLPEHLNRLAEEMGSERQEKVYQQKAGEKQERRCQSIDTQQMESRMKLLYCVSFNDLYYGAEKQIRKMRDIFDYMRRNPNVLLIFKPDEDIRARRQQLDASIWAEYEKLVAYFIRNRIGIYDESLNLYEAAVEADGIMCLSHPMEALFSIQGKYVLHVDWVQRVIPTVEDRCIPMIWDVAVEETEDKIVVWFVPEKTKLICKMNIPMSGNAKTWEPSGRRKAKKHLSGAKVEIVTEVPDEIVVGLNYANIIKIGNRIYLSPYGSNGIWRYDLQKSEFSKQYIPGADGACVTAMFLYGKYLYMIPRNYPGIIKYDTESEEFEVIDGWIGELERSVPEEDRNKPYFIFAVQQEENMLYMASSKCDIWMEFNMEFDTWKIRTMNLPGKKFAKMVKNGETVWLFPYDGNEIIVWNCTTDERKIIYSLEEQGAGEAPYLCALDLGDYIVAFPQRQAQHLFAARKQAVSMTALAPEEIRTIEKRQMIPCGESAYLSQYQKQFKLGYQVVKKLDSDMILAYEYYDGSFLVLNKNLGVIRKIPCRLPIEAVRKQQDIMYKNVQCRTGLYGKLSEMVSLPAMVECFIRHGKKDKE